LIRGGAVGCDEDAMGRGRRLGRVRSEESKERGKREKGERERGNGGMCVPEWRVSFSQ